MAENEITASTTYILLENDGKRLKFVKPPRSLAMNYYCAGKNDLGIGDPKGAYLNITCKFALVMNFSYTFTC